MKNKILILILFATIGLAGFISTPKSGAEIELTELININYASAEGTDDDEKDVCTTQSCSDGTTCECEICEKGTTDCSPTCPCCDEE